MYFLDPYMRFQVGIGCLRVQLRIWSPRCRFFFSGLFPVLDCCVSQRVVGGGYCSHSFTNSSLTRLSACFSHLPTHFHTDPFTYSLPPSFALTLSSSFRSNNSFSLTHSLTLSLSFTLPHSHSLSFIHSLSHSLADSFSSHSLTHSLT